MNEFVVYPHKTKHCDGIVYFVEADNGLVKIGRTKDLNRRIYGLSREFQARHLWILGFVEASNAAELENMFHHKFRNYAVGYEWFDLPPSEKKKLVCSMTDKDATNALEDRIQKPFVWETRGEVSWGLHDVFGIERLSDSGGAK